MYVFSGAAAAAPGSEIVVTNRDGAAHQHTMYRNNSTSRIFIAIAAGTLVFAACGGSDDGAPAAETTPAEVPAAEPASELAAESAAGSAIASTGSTSLGDVLVDANGLTLYGFTNDADGTPTYSGGCAEAWPPVIVAGGEVPAGLDTAVFSVASRDDGSMQLVAGKWPLYLFAGDAAAGDVNGRGSGDVWFAAAPDGSLIKEAQGAAAPAETEAEPEIDSLGEGY